MSSIYGGKVGARKIVSIIKEKLVSMRIERTSH